MGFQDFLCADGVVFEVAGCDVLPGFFDSDDGVSGLYEADLPLFRELVPFFFIDFPVFQVFVAGHICLRRLRIFSATSSHFSVWIFLSSFLSSTRSSSSTPLNWAW